MPHDNAPAPAERAPTTPASTPSNILQGFISEAEYARQRGVSLRTCQRDRALRQSPPHVRIGKAVYYRVDAVRDWLIARERITDRVPNQRRLGAVR